MLFESLHSLCSVLPMSTPDLDQLLSAAKAGDRAALIDLLEALGPQVRGRLLPKINGHVRTALDVDDLMQVTYIEAITRLDRFQDGGASGFLAWLTRLAENNLIDAVRALEAAKRPNPHKRVGINPRGDESVVGLVEVLGLTSATPSRAAAMGEGVRALQAALMTLPPDYERVIRMYDLECRPIEEIVRELGRSEGAIYMLRARAHDRLRELMGSAGKYFSAPG